MLIDKEYKRNKLTGEIVKRETVEIACDKCGKKWETAYSNRKRKVLENDLCASCRSKLVLSNRTITLSELRWGERPPKIEIVCKNCNKKQVRIPSLVNTGNNFCCFKCRDEYWVKSKYGHISEKFKNNPNEVAYLVGLILGDGHIRKVGKKTSRVCIAFDTNSKWAFLRTVAKDILDKLKVNWFEEPKMHKSCVMIGFIMPDEVLKEYGIFYSGDKFKSQPEPQGKVKNNINYAAGLLNSDGCFSIRKNGSGYYFCNTVETITRSLNECLNINMIKNRMYTRKGCFDERTGNTNKKQYNLYILGIENIKNLHTLCVFPMKGNINYER